MSSNEGESRGRRSRRVAAQQNASGKEGIPAKKEEEPDPEQMAKDMERLALIKKRREDQARARIEKDGWDRMKPLSEDNHPPGTQWPPPGGAS